MSFRFFRVGGNAGLMGKSHPATKKKVAGKASEKWEAEEEKDEAASQTKEKPWKSRPKTWILRNGQNFIAKRLEATATSTDH